jgi:myo-inositol-1(or 4)-monophosphatase
MHHYLNIAIKAARSAGKIISRHLDSVDTLTVYDKGTQELTTPVDKAAEDEIIAIIRQAYPSHAILSKESGYSEGVDCTWIVDPLNGSTNFVHGYPHFAIAIAIRQKEQIEHGIIYNPISQELFVATRGAGAQLNGRRLRIAKQHNFQAALIGMTYPLHCSTVESDTYSKTFQALALKCKDIRRSGSTALDLAYLAAGRLDGYWGMGLKSWDVAAGALMIREAGGFVDDSVNGSLIAGTRKVYAGLLHILEKP